MRVYPRSGPFDGPFGLRMCISDPNGVTDLDPNALSFRFNGEELSSDFLWSVAGESKLCGIIRYPGIGQQSLPGFRESRVWPAVVEARVVDMTGREAVDRAVYHAAELQPALFDSATEIAGLGRAGFGGNSHTLGPSWIDYDDDDFPDLFLPNGVQGANRIHRNNGDGTFEDVTDRTPLGLDRFEIVGALFADVDNDGDDDLYLLSGHPWLAVGASGEAGTRTNPVPGHRNFLFENHAGECFRDITEEAGLLDLNDAGLPYRTSAGAFADYDRDGCIDVFLVHWRMGGIVDPEFEDDRLYRGDCEGHFTDVTAEAGIDDHSRNGLAVLFADLNGDLYPDLYIVNVNEGVDAAQLSQRDDPGRHFGREAGDDLLFVNNGDGTFSEQTVALGVGPDLFAGMGIDVGDFDGDGDFDIYATDLDLPVGYGAVLYENQLAQTGQLGFRERAFELGSRPLTADFGWGATFGDFNLDGHLDLFTNGTGSRWIFLGNGEGDFDAATGPDDLFYPDDPSGMENLVSARGSAIADYDRDGDLDIMVMGSDPQGLQIPPVLYRNITPREGRHWLEVRLVGSRGSSTAIGAQVRVRPSGDEGPSMVRQVLGGHSSHGQSERILHFGLGPAERVAEVEVRWPSGAVSTLRDVAADQLLRVVEPHSEAVRPMPNSLLVATRGASPLPSWGPCRAGEGRRRRTSCRPPPASAWTASRACPGSRRRRQPSRRARSPAQAAG